MTSVVEHYETHLAPVYLWLTGGLDRALILGAADLSEVIDSPGYAVDLGAGFGMHTIPLARAGYRVLAIDTSTQLLDALRKHCAGPSVTSVVADLSDFPRFLTGSPDLILCMGDTLAHLQSPETIRQLFRDVAAAIRPGGRFIATVRDYRQLPSGDARFIPVRSDSHRILTCYLEEKPEHVVVHDIIHEHTDDGWQMKVSSYQKLRLSPEFLAQAAQAAGLHCRIATGPRGMLIVRANA